LRESRPTDEGAADAKLAAAPADTAVSRLAVTLGDPRGIGPEVAAKAAASLRARGSRASLLFVGPHGTAADGAAVEFVGTGEWRGGDAAEAGRVAGIAIETAARFAMEGLVHGIVTAPIDKAALHLAGYVHPGHTEMLAALANVRDVVMLMAAEGLPTGTLRVVLATTHLALRDVPLRLTTDLLVRQSRLTADALRDDWRIEHPRVALCAFNPHASDGGLFGDEEDRLYRPALESLHAAGIDARGPIPADTVFVRALRGEFDVVIAPYHDVGMAAFKTAAFGRGVNVTLGLPFIRTSPDHGTARDIAGRDVADASSMIEAIELADRIAVRRHGREAAT
jgi:4-hydroxythreonine-4-phosphate dehydrogenase